MKVEKNVPLPSKWPFKDMQVGDSFAVPTDISRTTVSIAALRYGRKHGMRFTVRTTTDRTLRCWRLE